MSTFTETNTMHFSYAVYNGKSIEAERQKQ